MCLNPEYKNAPPVPSTIGAVAASKVLGIITLLLTYFLPW